MSSKQVKMTQALEAKIRTAVGDEALDVSGFAVFEARALSTEPIRRKPGFYNNARFSRSTLVEMAAFLNTPGKAIPLQIMHDNEVLPVGKVFSAALNDLPNGETEVRVQFYLPANKANLVQDINNSLIDEVSVGVLTNKALCSECEFDYFGPDATFSNFMNLTCSNDHTIGVDGVHVRPIGLRDWAELSLVNRGAATDAKILSRAKQAMGEDTVNRLAASAVPIDARLFTTSNKLEAATSNITSKGDPSMDATTLALFQAKTDEVATLKAELGKATELKTGLETENASLKATIATKDAEIATLKETGGEKAVELAAQVTATQKELSDAVEKLLPHAKAALTASGVAEADLPKDFAGLFSAVEKAGLKLHQVFGADPKTVEAKAGATDSETGASFRNEAFKTR